MKNSAVIRTSPAVVIVPAQQNEPGGEIGIYEFLSKNFAYCPTSALYWLSYFKGGKSWKDAKNAHRQMQAAILERELNQLIELKFLCVDGNPNFTHQKEYEATWQWGISAGLFHFSVLNNSFASPEESTALQIERMQQAPSPALEWKNDSSAIPLPDPLSGDTSTLLKTMAARRTNRTSEGHSVSLQDLAVLLYSGLGINGYVKAPTGWLPLSMTPSGGARNPFEAFVFVQRGKDVAPGIYHYDAGCHTLGSVGPLPNQTISSMFANQDWMDDMAAVVVLTAIMDRTMWKYRDANAYRVLLIEAGHIAQNAMLAATQKGLTACPTAAISHDEMSRCLGLSGILHVPVYAFTVDRAKPYGDEVRSNTSFKFQAGDGGTLPTATFY